jgi:hypothetical protein
MGTLIWRKRRGRGGVGRDTIGLGGLLIGDA